MKLSNKVYDILKFLVIKVSPASIALITGLGLLYGFQTEIITGTISLVTVFIAAIMGISTKSYNEGIEDHPEGTDGSED